MWRYPSIMAYDGKSGYSFPNVKQWGQVGRYPVSEDSSDDSPLLCYLFGLKGPSQKL